MNLSPGECTYWSFLNVANEEVLELFPSPYWRTCPCLSSVVMSGLCPILYSSFLKLQPWNDRLRDVTMYITVCLVNKTHGFECVCVCVCASMCVCMHVPVDGPPNTSQYYIITITILYSRIVVQPKWLAECIFNCTFAALGVPELVMKCFYSKRTMHGFPDTRLLSSPSVHGNTIQCNASQYRIRIYIP